MAAARTSITPPVIEAWLHTLRSEHTRSAYRSDIEAFAAWCAPGAGQSITIDSPTIARYRDFHADQGASPASVNRRASAVNSLLRFASDDPAPGPTSGSSTTRPLAPVDREAILSALGTADASTRLLTSMLLLDGMKLDEALRLDTTDLTIRPDAVTAAVGVGSGARNVRLHPTTARFARARHRDGSGPMIRTAAKRGQAGTRLTRFGADYLLKRFGRNLGLVTPLTANALRRTHATHAVTSGESLADVQQRMGHDDVRTTRRYLPAATDPQTPTGGAGSRRRTNTRR